jgi:hypothetical protein
MARLALTDGQDGIRVKTRAPMRKNPTPDADPAGRPADADAPDTGVIPIPDAPAESPAAAASDHTAPSLVWPPVEDELNEWEVVPIQSTGHTVIEPMKFTPPPSESTLRSGVCPLVSSSDSNMFPVKAVMRVLRPAALNDDIPPPSIVTEVMDVPSPRTLICSTTSSTESQTVTP